MRWVVGLLVGAALLTTCSERDPGLESSERAVPRSSSENPRSLARVFDEVGSYPGKPWRKDGLEQTIRELSMAQGPEHCEWQRALFLGGEALIAPRDMRGSLWTRDPDGVLTHFPQSKQGFLARADLPADAMATGFTQGAVELWTAPSDATEFVYLVNADDRSDVERWVRGGGGCA